MSDLDDLLKKGITAVKRGDKENGRNFLMQVLEIDDRHEQAWLWLSGAVEDQEERIICLENVLAINPDNKLAQKGLARFKPDAGKAEQKRPASNRIMVELEETPVSPASAILYPDRHIKQVEWSDPTETPQPTEQVGYQTADSYDDVWSRQVDICAYCAHEVDFDDRKCPHCNRNLMVKMYQYERVSTTLTAYWVLLFAISQFYLIQGFVDIIALRNLLLAFFSFIMTGVFFAVAIGIYFRKHWAFTISVVLLLMIVVSGLLSLLVPIDLSALNLEQYDISITRYVEGVTGFVYVGLRGIRLVTAVLALIFAIFKVAGDFEQAHKRQIAVLSKGLSTGTDYHMAARRLAKVGLWASAVLHWQRASALEPARIIYQRDLGKAYAHLGFTQRAKDVLQSAQARNKNEMLRVEIQEILDTIPEI